ncbi:MAG: hypothetical protein QOE28_2022 [Solirubrobacteraceae bacterium]|jgi:hypothetical protein|nr:hypothetical protein [Solirubrobacteraceae bacterium]
MRVPRPTYSGVTATLALVLALGGGAYAAASLPKNSVGAKQIKKNAVVSAKIKNNAVTGAKVKDNSLTGADVNEATLGAVPSAAHATSADSATSATSATNATNAGHAGSAAALDKVTKVSVDATAPQNDVGTATATCPAGSKTTGGGGKTSDPQNDYMIDTYPTDDGTGWTARIWHGTTTSTSTGAFTAYALCVAAGS